MTGTTVYGRVSRSILEMSIACRPPTCCIVASAQFINVVIGDFNTLTVVKYVKSTSNLKI